MQCTQPLGGHRNTPACFRGTSPACAHTPPAAPCPGRKSFLGNLASDVHCTNPAWARADERIVSEPLQACNCSPGDHAQVSCGPPASLCPRLSAPWTSPVPQISSLEPSFWLCKRMSSPLSCELPSSGTRCDYPSGSNVGCDPAVLLPPGALGIIQYHLSGVKHPKGKHV